MEREALRNLLIDFEEPAHLEAVGRELTVERMCSLLEIAASEPPKIQARLIPILVGLPHPIFLHTLLKASPLQLQMLKNESFSEPVQLHLIVVIHDLEQECAERDQAMNDLFETIKVLKGDALDSVLVKLIEFEQNNLRMIDVTNKALPLAWNSGRSDLIEKLSKIKENRVHTNRDSLGAPRTERQKARGLYLEIEKALEDVFGLPGKIETIRDDEPAVDGLTKLGIWYEKEHKELGLSETPQKELSKVGLKTVSDLKREHLYSRDSLIRYLLKHNAGTLIPIDSSKKT